MINNRKNIRRTGYTVIEIMIVSAVFLIIALGSSKAIIQTYTFNRTSQNLTEAKLIALEGKEAVRSIKNTGWNNIPLGNYGLRKSAGYWELFGTEDIIDKYTRQIRIASIQRDAYGNLVESGGALDPSVKKITVNVRWLRSPGNFKEINDISYIADWEQEIPEGFTGGMLAYADYSGSDDIVRFKIFNKDDKTWGEEQTVPDIGVPDNRNVRRVEIYSSSTRNEKILLTKHSEDGQFLYMQTWNGFQWGNLINLYGYGDDTNPETRNFDGDYLSNGNFIAAYDNFSYSTQYRIWNGVSWTTEKPTQNTGGYPVWVTVRTQPGTNNAIAVVKDYSKDTNTMNWNGSNWSSPTEHSSDGSSTSLEIISFEWSPSSPNIGGLMFSNNDSGYFFNRTDLKPDVKFINNTTWGSRYDNISVLANSHTMELAVSPISTQYLGCVKDVDLDINCLLSTGGAWTAITDGEIAVNSSSGRQKTFSVGYEGISGELAIVVYANGEDEVARHTPKYRIYDPDTNSMNSEMTLPELKDELKSVRVLPDRDSDDIMVVMGDDSEDLYTIVWDGENNEFYSGSELGLIKHNEYGSSGEDYWYDFDWGYDREFN